MNRNKLILVLFICSFLSAETTYFSDFRYRYEIENDTLYNYRDRQRIRARMGVKYILDGLEVGIRLATAGDAITSPHQTLGANGTEDNITFGLDRAFLKYQFGSSTLTFGKNSINLWKQNEVLMDDDYSPEGISYSYTRFGLILNTGYYLLNENNWDYGVGKDENLLTHQLVYGFDFGNILSKFSFTNAILTEELDTIVDPDTVMKLDSKISTNIFSSQFKMGNHILGLDFHLTNENSDNSAFIAMIKTKLFGHSLGLWYYGVSKNGVISHDFTQDNFPKSDAGFSGFRFQIGAKLSNSTNVDIRYYIQTKDSDNDKINRIQFNLNVKF